MGRRIEHAVRDGMVPARAGGLPQGAGDPRGDRPADRGLEETTHRFSLVAGDRYPCMHWPYEPHRSQSEADQERKFEEAWRNRNVLDIFHVQKRMWTLINLTMPEWRVWCAH